MLTRRLVEQLPIESEGFEYDNELVCKLLRRGYRIEEVPITYHPRTYEHGKKIKWTDGIRMVWTIVKWRFRRLPRPIRAPANAAPEHESAAVMSQELIENR